MDRATPLTCRCGRVGLELRGEPIVATACLCTSCRTAGKRFESLPGAPRVLDRHAATPFVLYRKDRVACSHGAELLREHRLTARSKTRRVLASCCNTPVFLEFSGGHWLSLYGTLFPPEVMPAIELRTMTRDLPEAAELPADVPNAKTQSFWFFRKLFAAWVAMGFRTPKISYVKGALHAD